MSEIVRNAILRLLLKVAAVKYIVWLIVLAGMRLLLWLLLLLVKTMVRMPIGVVSMCTKTKCSVIMAVILLHMLIGLDDDL